MGNLHLRLPTLQWRLLLLVLLAAPPMESGSGGDGSNLGQCPEGGPPVARPRGPPKQSEEGPAIFFAHGERWGSHGATLLRGA